MSAKPRTPEHRISPELLAAVLGRNRPTEQQGAITGAPPGPRLVVAGAGAGKTETMASRAVWLVANGFVDPENILGLTFTRKAAQELRVRITDRLAQLAGTPKVRDLDPSGELAEKLVTTEPTVLTYDAYAGRLIREYGLLLPVEPTGRIITQTELTAITQDLVRNYTGRIPGGNKPATVVENLLALHSEMGNHQVGPEDIVEESRAFAALFQELPKGPRQKDTLNKTAQKWHDTQLARVDYLELLEQLRTELTERGVVTFGEQMAMAARLASEHLAVGKAQRALYHVVMLDEYQDTSHAQRVLLSSLFGHAADPNLTVNAVGDPMQAIYGWRGATAANLSAFVEDFPTAEGPAPKSEMTISFRNPAEVLELANVVAEQLLGPPETPGRAVSPLEPFAFPGAEKPEETPISLGWFRTIEEERAYVADEMAKRYQQAQEENRPFSGAVLIRNNRQAVPIAEELAARGIPYEIVGVSGLLRVPEVADTVALATMLIRPFDNAAALRILAGPLVGLGIADIQALHRRARNLAARANTPESVDETDVREAVQPPVDALSILEKEIAEAAEADPEQVVGLTDAIADLGEPGRFSEEGYKRLSYLSARLRHLRRHSLTKALPDLFADIIDIFNIRIEVLARSQAHTDGAAGTVHLDRLIEEVTTYDAIPHSTLSGLLDYFTLAEEHEDGLAMGTVEVRADQVQILTIHKSKGLEWDHVAVIHADKQTWTGTTETFLTQVKLIPADLRGDAGTTAPLLDTSGVETRSDLENACKAYLEEVKGSNAEEATRLFYVALTRSGKDLLVTGSAFRGGTREYPPYGNFELLKNYVDTHHPDAVAHWYETGAEHDDEVTSSPTPPAQEDQEAQFPRLDVDDRTRRAADAVYAAMDVLPPVAEDELSQLWEADVEALISEYAALQAPELEVELSEELTASDLVALRADPEQFARRARRPVPFKPNAYAKRGTAFHSWVENLYGKQSLLDEDQLPGMGEEVVGDGDVEKLKEQFLESSWAQRTPPFRELPFEVRIGSAVVRGRMDAVFYDENDNVWDIVDWKTGQPPTAQEKAAAEIQLAVYAYAFKKLLATWEKRGAIPVQEAREDVSQNSPEIPMTEKMRDAQVRASFHYVRWGTTLTPRNLPDGAELERLLAQATQAD